MYQDGEIEIMQNKQVLSQLSSLNDIKGRIRLRWLDHTSSSCINDNNDNYGDGDVSHEPIATKSVS